MNSICLSNNGRLHAIKHMSALDMLPDCSSVSSNVANKFIYFVNLLTHQPWHIDKSGIPSNHGGSFETRDYKKAYGVSKYHLYSEIACLKKLIKWFNWMKSKKIYDNTHIILVSDHEIQDSPKMFKTYGRRYPKHSHALLLQKFRNSHGELTIDRKFQMANYDVPSLVIDHLLNKETLYLNRDRFHVEGYPRIAKHQKNQYVITNINLFKGGIYEKEKWTRSAP